MTLGVGQRVRVVDQRPPAEGVVEEVSTWGKILGVAGEDTPCYYVRCEEWQGTARWISGLFVEAVTPCHKIIGRRKNDPSRST